MRLTVDANSQREEQDLILKWADGKQGSFLDLGCYDGVTYSTTAELADRGWRGLMVDAAPDAAARCAERYAHHPGVKVACGTFSVGQEPPLLHWSLPTGPNPAMYSSLKPNPRDDIRIVPLYVAKLDLDWLRSEIRRLPRPMFVNIDLEGESMNALFWLLANTEFDCICVEANNDVDRDTVLRLLPDWENVPLQNPSNLLLQRV